MTVTTTSIVSDWVAANGSNKNWSYDFSLFLLTDVVLEYKNGVNGDVIEATSNLGFFPDSDFVGGYVQYPVVGAALANTYFVRVRRTVPLTQTQSFGNQGSFLPELHERAFDRLTMQIQQMNATSSLAITVPVGETPGVWNAGDEDDIVVFGADGGAKSSGKSVAELVAEATAAASGYADNAADSADDAEADRILAQAARVASEAARDSALAAFDNFDDKYLGAKTADPTLDNDGNALTDGSLYFNTTNNLMMVYDLGTTTWLAAYVNASNVLIKTNNLSDLANAATARTNLGLGTASNPQFATIELGAAADTTLSRVSAGVVAVEGANLLRHSQNLADVANAATAFGNIKQAATTSATGVVERSTVAEVKSGTDNVFPTSKDLTDASAFFALVDGATITISHNDGRNQKVTIAGNRNFAAPTNMKEGEVLNLQITQDATGSRVPTYNSAFDFGDFGTPTLSTGANNSDLLSFIAITSSKFAFTGIRRRVD